ncbi:MAG TPA: calcineurin-like phosphoesterase family protein [Acidobacteriota bacterium]|nr:calcineurin-like phosphoesterase family protein [Acidobacteriota bacterium]
MPNRRIQAASRRAFLGHLGTLAAAAALSPLGGELWGARSPRSVVLNDLSRPRPQRVRGRVHAAGRGLASVALSDGVTVVDSDAEGYFELVGDTRARFLSLSLPAGYAIPRNPTGTARLYAPLQPDQKGEAEVEFELRKLSRSDSRHTFYQLADPQTRTIDEMRWFQRETVPEVARLAAEQAGGTAFGIGCGDIMYDVLSLYPEYEKGVQAMGIPFFQVVGNHDLDFESHTNPGASSTFQSHFGPSHYSFNRGAVHYVVLNSVFWHGDGYIGYLSEGQLAWLKQDLARVEAGSPVVVALHIPVNTTNPERRQRANRDESGRVQNRQALYHLLEPFQAHIVSGHLHESEHMFEGGVHEHISGAVCGAWWSGPICHDGTPMGYAVYQVDGEDLSWRYQSTGKPPEHQMRLYPPGSDPLAPEEVVANIWDWDPKWKVTCYQDGQAGGPMARRIGLDPLSVQLHTGHDLPAKNSWVEPMPTGHLFYAPVAPGVRRITVEAVDRFGRTYREDLNLQ